MQRGKRYGTGNVRRKKDGRFLLAHHIYILRIETTHVQLVARFGLTRDGAIHGHVHPVERVREVACVVLLKTKRRLKMLKH